MLTQATNADTDGSARRDVEYSTELFLARHGRENPQLLQHACHGHTCGAAVRSPPRIPHQSQPGEEGRGERDAQRGVLTAITPAGLFGPNHRPAVIGLK